MAEKLTYHSIAVGDQIHVGEGRGLSGWHVVTRIEDYQSDNDGIQFVKTIFFSMEAERESFLHFTENGLINVRKQVS